MTNPDASSPLPKLIHDPLDPPPGLIPIGEIAGAGEDTTVAIDNSTLDQHMVVVGKTGAGKSQWLRWVSLGIAKAGYPLVVIDPHGALADELLNTLIADCPERRADIVYCDMSDPGSPVAVNPLDVSSVGQVDGVVGAVSDMLLAASGSRFAGEGTPRAMAYARDAVTALCHANLALEDPHLKCTLSDVATFFTDIEFRQLVVESCRDESIKETYDFDAGQFEQLGDTRRLEHVGPILRAISALCGTEPFDAVFSSAQNKLDFSRLIGSDKILIIKLARFVGAQAEAGRMAGALVLPWLLSSMETWGRRKDPTTGAGYGRGCRVIVDGAPALIGQGSSVPDALTESRKMDVGLVLAAQFMGQFSDSVADALLANTGSKISFAQDPNIAGSIGRSIAGAGGLFGVRDLAGLPNYHFYGNIPSASGPTGPFSAGALSPLEDRLGPDDIEVREQVLDASRALVVREAERYSDQRIDDVMNALKTNLRARGGQERTSSAAPMGDESDKRD